MTQYLSASRLKRYRQCPHQSKFEPFKRSKPVDFGNAVHAGMAAAFTGKDPMEAFRDVAKKLDLIGKDEHAKMLIERALDDPKTKVDPNDILSVESEDGEVEFYGKKFFQVDIVPGIWGIRGAMDRVDLINGQLRIIDWKTGHTEEDDDLQLACYALASHVKYPGIDMIETAFYYMERGFYDSRSWTTEDLTGALEYIEGLANNYINETVWPATPHKYCKYCSLRLNCDAFKSMLEKEPESPELEETIENLPEILIQLDKADAIEKAAKSITEDLKSKRNNILLEHGAQVVDGVRLSANAYTSAYAYDVAKIFQQVQDLIGRAPFEILSLNAGELDRMATRQAKEMNKEAGKQLKASFKEIKESFRDPKSQSVRIKKKIVS